MARIFTEGFEMGDYASLSDASDLSISSSWKRSGSYGLTRQTGNGVIGKGTIPVSEESELFVRFGLYAPSVQSNGVGNKYFNIFFRHGITELCSMELQFVDPDIYVHFFVEGVDLELASPPKYIPGSWQLFELNVKIDDASGVIILKQDGVETLSYSGDTKPGADTTIDNVYFEIGGYNYVTADRRFSIDDIAINDTTGTEDNSWCGDGHVILYKPNATGSATMLMGNDEDQTDNYLLVDDIPSDGDTTYVYSGSAGYYDLYKLEDTDLPVNYRITRAWVEARAKDPETNYVSGVIQTVSGSYTSASVQLTTDYSAIKFQEYTTNPSTGSAWTSDEIDYLQAGVMIEEE